MICFQPYLDLGVEPSVHSNADASTVLMEARMNSNDWFNAYVSEEHVSNIIAPNLILPNRVGSLFILSIANNIASNRCMPRSLLIGPQCVLVKPVIEKQKTNCKKANQDS